MTLPVPPPPRRRQGRVLEADNLDGAARGLGAGYGQSKWVSERLLMAAQAAGFPATIVRPGYISGHSTAGVTNADDFLWPGLFSEPHGCTVTHGTLAVCDTSAAKSPAMALKCTHSR